MNKRKLSLSKHGISKKRYNELLAFCQQYPEWVEYLESEQDTVKSPGLSGMPTAGVIGDSTGLLGIKRAEISQKKEIIDSVASSVTDDLQEYIIANVCYERPVWFLIEKMGMPCSESAFYDIRRHFFYKLNEKR